KTDFVSVPLKYCEKGSLFIRLAKVSSNWSNGIQVSQLMKSKEDIQILDCGSVDAILRYQSNENTITLSSPFSIENLLGCSIDYELYDKETEICHGTLQNGERCFFDSTKGKNILMKCKPSEETWKFSDFSLIYSPTNQNSVINSIPITNKNGDIL